MAVERAAPSLLASLRASGLLSDAQLDELVKCPEARDPAPTPLARAVFQRGWLTGFQLNMVAAGRAKELTVGPYVVLDRLGEGGMGMVYKARHQHMQRTVALKVIRKEKLASPDAVKRFYQEAQLAAALHHPNIALAYDAGQAGSTHYLAMEFIEGIDLARLVKEQGKLPVAQACEYVRQAALGLQHAHEKGLVHRDVKPHNLLVSRAPEGQGDVVKLLDLGLARLQGAGDTGLTKLGAVIGTPDYLAPEQALNSKAADIRADLYSLGCTLYYLLTGGPPFSAGELTEVLIKHQMEKPAPLAVRGVKVPAEVQAILDRLMAKDPGDRYQTPAELVEALAPFCRAGTLAATGLNVRHGDEAEDDWAALSQDDKKGKASTSRSADGSPTSELPRAGAVVRSVRRKKGDEAAERKKRLVVVVAGGGAALVLLGLVLYLIFGGSKPEPVAQGPRATEPTRKGPTDADKPKTSTHRGGIPPPVVPVGGGPVAVVPGKLALPANEGGFRALAISPDGKHVAIGQFRLRLWDLSANKELHDFGGKSYFSLRAVAWSADGRRVLVGGSKNVGGFPAGVLTLFEARDGTVVKDFDTRGGDVHAVAISPDGKYVLSTDESVRRWEVATGKEVTRYQGPKAPTQAVGFSADGESVYAAATDLGNRAAYVWDVDKPEGRRIPFDGDVRSRPVFSADGRQVAVSAGFFWIAYDLATGKEVRRSEPLPVPTWSVGWSRDGRFIACGAWKAPRAPGTAHVYLTDATTGKLVQTFEGHDNTVEWVAVSPDGGFVLSTSSDGARLWTRSKPQSADAGSFTGHEGEVTCVAFCDGGKKLVSGSVDKTVRVWDFESGKQVSSREFLGPINCLAVTTDGRAAYLGFADGWALLLHNVVSVPLGSHARVGPEPGPNSTLEAIAVSPDGHYLARVGKDLVPDANPRPKTRPVFLGAPLNGHSIACSSDGKLLAVGADDGTIHVFDVEGDKLREKLPIRNAHKGPVLGLAFVAKTTQLLSGGSDGALIGWDAPGGRELIRFAGPDGRVIAVAASPDGRHVAAGGAGGAVRVWGTQKSAAAYTFTGHKGAVRGVAFSPDGRYVVSCGDSIRLWDLRKP